MFILHLVLGGCLKAPPVNFGVTADTGGHIAYVLDAACHQALRSDVDAVTIVTRCFSDERLDPVHAQAEEVVAPKVTIRRIATADHRHLEKEALGADLAAFTEAFCEMIEREERRPDVIHAHFADAAAVAMAAQRRFGIPFVYTPHALGIDKRMQRLECPGLDARIAAERAAIAAIAFTRLGSADVEGELGGYRILDDQTVEVTVSVTREDPSRPVVCIVRARSYDGTETGRRELLVPPADETTVQVTTLVKTSAPAVVGDVYGCGTDVPPYLVGG